MHLSTPSTPAVCYENADNKLAYQGGTFFGTRDRFYGRQLRTGVQAVMQVMGSNGEQHMKLHSLNHHSPSAMQPSS